MATTITEIVATNCVILLDSAIAVPTDISGSLNSVTYSPENGIARWHTFGTQWPQRRVVHKDMGVSINGVYTTNGAEVAQLIENWFFGGNDSARTLWIFVPDQGVGAYTLSGEFILADYEVNLDAEADDVVRITINLEPDNTVTRGTNIT
jgi:predicted secreted protein